MTLFGHYHAYRKKLHKKHKRSSVLLSIIDESVYLFAIFAVAANIPQLLNIWVGKNVEGVSIVSWIGFLIASIFWLWYGLLHKEMPIIFINFLLILVQGAIVLGLFFSHLRML